MKALYVKDAIEIKMHLYKNILMRIASLALSDQFSVWLSNHFHGPTLTIVQPENGGLFSVFLMQITFLELSDLFSYHLSIEPILWADSKDKKCSLNVQADFEDSSTF